MSIAVLRRKTKFKNRIGANRTDYNYIGQPKGLAYRGFILNMSNRGNVTGRKFINSGKLSPKCFRVPLEPTTLDIIYDFIYPRYLHYKTISYRN